MSVPASRSRITHSPACLRLAVENGRRIGRTSKAKRLAAKPGADAARCARMLSEVYADALHVLKAAMAAEDVAKAAFSASCGGDSISTRALARETMISAGYAAARLSNLLSLVEQTRSMLSDLDWFCSEEDQRTILGRAIIMGGQT